MICSSGLTPTEGLGLAAARRAGACQIILLCTKTACLLGSLRQQLCCMPVTQAWGGLTEQLPICVATVVCADTIILLVAEPVPLHSDQVNTHTTARQ